ncbi:helix-turn-helix domain-containing protein [Candidatus Zixiibacteriota bacterium]
MQYRFNTLIRKKRIVLRERGDRSFSLRQVAFRIGVEPSYLSKIERGALPPPSEEKVVLLAGELGVDADYLLSLAGKVASDLQLIIRERPVLYGRLIRTFQDVPDDSVQEFIDQVEKG